MRIVIGVFALYILLLAGLSIYLASSKQKLLGFVNAKLKETILGELKITNADITVWQTFPKFGITLQNVSITDSFYHSPFLRANEIIVKVGIFDLMGSKVSISSVKINHAALHIFTDKNGYTNSYVLGSQSSQKQKRQSKKPFVLENLEMNDVAVLIEDIPKSKRYQGRINNADIDMRLKGSTYYITFREDLFLRGLGFNTEQGYWMENQPIKAKWKLEFNNDSNKLTVKKSNVRIKNHSFEIEGDFDFAKSEFHINASTKNIIYDSAVSILKPRTRNVLHKLNLSKPVNVAVELTGSLSKAGDPFVNANFSTENANVTTPIISLPHCKFAGSFTNQVNKNILPDDSNSRVQINSFTINQNNIFLTAKNLSITNLDSPIVKFECYTQCTFPQLDKVLSSSTLHFISGTAKLYLAYNGPLIADPSLLNKLDAKIDIANGNVIYVPRNLTFSQCSGAINFVGNNLNISNLQCNLNTNHFEVNVSGSNLNRISSKEQGKATLNVNVFTPAVNLSDFTSLFNSNTPFTSTNGNGISGVASSIDDAVENGDIFINLKAQQLSLNNFKATNATANLLFTNNDWGIQKAFLQFADGSFNLTAKVHQVNSVSHQVNAQLNLQRINVKKLFYAFDNFSQTSLTSRNLTGVMNSNANISMLVNSSGKFVPSSLNGKMFFSIKNAELNNFQPLLNVQEFVFKNRNLDHVQFAELKDSFDIQNGDIYIHRMPIQSSAFSMYIEGIYSFKSNTDISIQVPLSNLKNNSDDDFSKINKKKANRPGASIYLRAKDKDGQVKIGLDVFRKLRRNNYWNNK